MPLEPRYPHRVPRTQRKSIRTGRHAAMMLAFNGQTDWCLMVKPTSDVGWINAEMNKDFVKDWAGSFRAANRCQQLEVCISSQMEVYNAHSVQGYLTLEKTSRPRTLQ